MSGPPPIRPAPRGLKKQIFGAVAAGIGLFNAGTDPAQQADLFDWVLVGMGVVWLLYGSWERRRGSGEG
ncbi:MAG: hypothetical protein H7836_02740 [Magnetococcus sp. YQC-3]